MQGFWKKAEYFWMYYKIPFLAVIAVCTVVFYFGHAKLTEKEYALNAMLLDVHTDENEEALAEEFAQYAGIDRGKYDVTVSTSLLFSHAASSTYSMTSLARFNSLVGTQELDVCAMLEEDFDNYEKSDCFLNLEEVFSQEELAAFPALYRDKNGTPVGVYAGELPKIQEIEGYQGENTKAVAGIIYNTTRRDAAKKFLEYLNK